MLWPTLRISFYNNAIMIIMAKIYHFFSTSPKCYAYFLFHLLYNKFFQGDIDAKCCFCIMSSSITTKKITRMCRYSFNVWVREWLWTSLVWKKNHFLLCGHKCVEKQREIGYIVDCCRNLGKTVEFSQNAIQAIFLKWQSNNLAWEQMTEL